MTRQPHLYDAATATVTSRQATLFDPNDVAAGDCPLTCRTCDRPMVRTASGYLCCPAGHGKLIDEGATDRAPDQDDQDGADLDDVMGPTRSAHLPWPRYAWMVACRHRRRAAFYQIPPCTCGACMYSAARRIDGARKDRGRFTHQGE
jgi:hypothetical protein